MNKSSTRKTDKDCNVCGSAVEIVDCTASQCSNRDCVTRHTFGSIGDEKYDGLPTLNTDSSDEEIIEYWKTRSQKAEEYVPMQDEIDEDVMKAYRKYNRTGDPQQNGRVNALLPYSSFSGWGSIKIEAKRERE